MTKAKFIKHNAATNNTFVFLETLSKARGFSSSYPAAPTDINFIYLILSILELNRLFLSSPHRITNYSIAIQLEYGC